MSGRQIFHTVINPLVSLRNAHFIFKCIFYAKIHFFLCKNDMSFCFSQKHQCMISSRFIYVTFKTAFNIRPFADQIRKNFYQQVLRIVEIFYISVYVQRQLVTVNLHKPFKSLCIARKVIVINYSCIHH